MRVPGHIAEQNLLIKTDAVYPEFARRSHIEGTVTMDVVVDANGEAQSVVPVKGPEELYRPAENSVRQWRFYPYRLNGVEVPFDTRISITFKLSEIDM